MPKGVPKTDGEKLKDKFDASYVNMKKGYSKGKGRSKKGCKCESCKKK
jgi:hypothetical protein